MNAAQCTTTDPEGLDLRKQFEHLYLRRLIKEIQNEELSLDDVAKCGRGYCDLLKRDAAHERNAVAREKNTIAYEKNTIAREKNDIARLAATRRRARSPSPDPQAPYQPEAPARAKTNADPFDQHAPWGRRPDGTPYTHAEFNTALSHAVRDIYGIHDFHVDAPSSPPASECSNEPPPLPPSANPQPALDVSSTRSTCQGSPTPHPFEAPSLQPSRPLDPPDSS